MTQARLPMHHAREILRLSREMKMTGRAIAKSLSLSTSTVSKYLKHLEGVPWPLPDPGGEALLARTLAKKKSPSQPVRIEPDWDTVHRELQSHKGVTLLLLWEEYRQEVKDKGYSYSRFCSHHADYAKRLKPSFRNTYSPGDRLFVDYAGTAVPIRDPKTGEVAMEAQVFVAVLGFSAYVYSEATPSQELPHWIASHVRCFEHLGGVAALLVPDYVVHHIIVEKEERCHPETSVGRVPGFCPGGIELQPVLRTLQQASQKRGSAAACSPCSGGRSLCGLCRTEDPDRATGTNPVFRQPVRGRHGALLLHLCLHHPRHGSPLLDRGAPEGLRISGRRPVCGHS